jgi:hypothetical protein
MEGGRDLYLEIGDSARLHSQLAERWRKGIEIVYGERKNMMRKKNYFYWADHRAAKAEQNLLRRHNKPNEPTQEETL